MQFKKIHLIIIILLGLLTPVFAAELTASVDSSKIDFGKSFELKITLTGAEAVGPLELAAVASKFVIYGQQQYSSYVNTNGRVTSETGWNITLLPRSDGEFIIPSVSVETDKGRISSKELKVTVTQAGQNQTKADDVLGVSLISTVSSNKTFIKKPIIYTLKLIAYKPVINMSIEDIKSNDAIIERIGDVKQYEQRIGGVNAAILEINYSITPLKTGKIKINPMIVHGEIQEPIMSAPRSQRFGIYNQMFMNNGYQLKPFGTKGEVITIESQDIPSADKSLLALDKLTLSEKWDGLNQARVGETFTRKVTLIAHGSFANQLPSVKSFMEVNGIKAYASKPLTMESIDQKGLSVIGRREEEFSLVPQRAGSITLPEIKVKWWNTASKKIEESVLPAKTIEVLPASAGASTGNTMIDYSSAEEPVTISDPTSLTPKVDTTSNRWLYSILAGLVVIILGLFALVVYLLRRKPESNNQTKVRTPVKSKITNPIQLRQAITEHAIARWGASRNITLNKLGAHLTEQNYEYDMGVYLELSQQINATLYAKSSADLSALLELWTLFQASVSKGATKAEIKTKSIDYTNINPT